jgi:uncharacterized protein YndB with AHSA1/START domain
LTTQMVSTQEVTAEIVVEAPISQIYYLFSTRSGWFDWFTQKGSGNIAKDSLLQLHHDKAGPMAFFFHEIVPEKRITFSYLTPNNWLAGEVEISLQESAGGTAITIEHSGIAEEDAAQMQDLWQDSLNNLKELMENGRDPRLWNRPFLGVSVADWVSPEYAEKHQLPTESGMHIANVFEGRGAEKAGISGGDTITSLAGQAITDFDSLLRVYADHRAGDTVDVEYYHGKELRHSRLTLSAYPVPDVPATAQDIADNLDQFFQKANQKIEEMLAAHNEAQAEYRPAAGEWNVKEILAHLVSTESDSIHWLSSYLAGGEVYPNTGGLPARIKSLLMLYPTASALLKKLRQTQKELLSLISEIPAEVVNRKASMVRLAFAYSLEISYHYKDHLSQIAANLEEASDIHGH